MKAVALASRLPGLERALPGPDERTSSIMQVSDWVSVVSLAGVVALALIYLFSRNAALRQRAWRLLELILGGGAGGGQV